MALALVEVTAEPGVLGSVLVVATAVVVALVLVATGRRRHLPTLAVVASLVLVVVATALPTHWTATSGAELRLAPGHGGLGKAGLQLLRGSPGAAVELFALNGLVYLPVGVALAWRWPSRWALLVVPLVVSCGVETLQYLALERVAATDDVLLNVVGAVVGWLIAWWVGRTRRDRLPDVAAVVTLAVVLVTTLLRTHPEVGSVGRQWQPVLGHGGGGTALTHLLAGDLDRAVQVVALLVVVYVPFGAALAWARPGRPAWLALPLVVSVVVELSQYQWLDRVASLDDVVITTGSAVVGWLVVTALRRRAHPNRVVARR